MKLKSNLREQIQELEEQIEEVKNKIPIAKKYCQEFPNLCIEFKRLKKELIHLVNIQRNIKEKVERLEEYYEK